ncbi:MAG TPA: L-seryl-tRNA(Sec) selenium transferase [Vicinamibacteria bacterium]|jgi:L-seryl-tRNA(Ser) seleniumtransferase
MPATTGVDPRRLLPSVDQALQRPELRPLVEAHGRPAVLSALRHALDALRQAAPAELGRALEGLVDAVRLRLAETEQPSLVRVLNATGVAVHTNLGRAPLSARAAERIAVVATGYSNLEYDLERGERGAREAHVEARLVALLGVEAALVVNNCAAAVLLAVNTLAEGRDVLVSRGELVEIGGSFRMPDVVRKAGGRLVEVGTTNRTRLADFAAALSPQAGLILRVHPSNFRVVGFTEEPRLEDLAALARSAGIALAFDQGSGLVAPPPGTLQDEPTVAEALRGGAELVTFSGDKLLGGPQAGVVAGRRERIAPMLKNPLYRALRPDKLSLAALDATLVEHQLGRAHERLPLLRMLAATPEELRARAEAFARTLRQAAPALAATLVASESRVGGGAAPDLGLATVAIALDAGARGPDDLARALRMGAPPVVARVAEGRVLLDLRTIQPDEEAALAAAVVAAAG